MANDARGHPVPAGTDHPSRASLLTLSLGIRDPIPVADTTARGTLITTLTSAGVGPSTSNPVIVYRADSGTLELTTDGTNWSIFGDRTDSTWVVAWTGSTTNPVIGNGSMVGNYSQDDRFVDFDLTVTAGSTTTFGSGNYAFNLPVSPLGTGRKKFVGSFLHSTTDYPILGHAAGSTVLNLFSNAFPVGNISSSAPVAPASGDVYHIAGRYRWA